MDENGCDHYLSQKYSLSIHIGLIVSSYKGMSANMTKEQQGTKIRFSFGQTADQLSFQKIGLVLNFPVKTHIKLFELQTPRNVLKHMTPKWGGHIWPFHHALRSRWVGGDQLSRWQEAHWGFGGGDKGWKESNVVSKWIYFAIYSI